MTSPLQINEKRLWYKASRQVCIWHGFGLVFGRIGASASMDICTASICTVINAKAGPKIRKFGSSSTALAAVINALGVRLVVMHFDSFTFPHPMPDLPFHTQDPSRTNPAS